MAGILWAGYALGMNNLAGTSGACQVAAELGQFLLDADTKGGEIIEKACRAHPPVCRACGGERLYRLSDGRYVCSRCERAFDLMEGRWLGRHRLSEREWLLTLKGFELGLDARQLSDWSGVPRATAHRALITIRLALACLEPDWVEVVRLCLAGVEPPPVAVRRRAGRVFAWTTASGQEAPSEPLDGRATELLREHLASRRGISERFFPLYLKEFEHRFNAVEGSLFGVSLDAVARHVPRKLANLGNMMRAAA